MSQRVAVFSSKVIYASASGEALGLYSLNQEAKLGIGYGEKVVAERLEITPLERGEAVYTLILTLEKI